MISHWEQIGVMVPPQADILDTAEMGKRHVKSLPPHYTSMDLDVSLPPNEALYVPALNTNSHPHPASRPLINLIEEGYQWLES